MKPDSSKVKVAITRAEYLSMFQILAKIVVESGIASPGQVNTLRNWYKAVANYDGEPESRNDLDFSDTPVVATLFELASEVLVLSIIPDDKAQRKVVNDALTRIYAVLEYMSKIEGVEWSCGLAIRKPEVQVDEMDMLRQFDEKNSVRVTGLDVDTQQIVWNWSVNHHMALAQIAEKLLASGVQIGSGIKRGVFVGKDRTPDELHQQIRKTVEIVSARMKRAEVSVT